jgi:hypothetical protein
VNTNGTAKHHPTEADARRIEQNIDETRDHLGDLLTELNRRRRDALNIRLQMQRRPAAVVLAAVAVVGALAGIVVLAVHRRHRRRSLGGRADRMRVALRAIASHPELLAQREPTVSRKVAAAGGSAVASVLGKALAKRLVST